MNPNRIYRMIQPYLPVWGICGLVLVVNLVVYMGWIRNQQAMIAEKNQAYITLRQSWMASARTADRSGSAGSRQAALEEFMHSLPPLANLSDVARDLGTFIQREHLAAEKIEFKPERIGRLKLWKYTAGLSVTGRYDHIKQFLADIRGSGYLICIEQLSLKKSTLPDHVNLRARVATYCR